MKKSIAALCAFLMIAFAASAQVPDTLYLGADSINMGFHYETGTIKLPGDNATIEVPAGFRFLDKAQAKTVLTDLWGNPEDNTILGLLVPENHDILDSNAWLYTLSFEPLGYVKDEDADDINYDELLQDMKKDQQAENAQRIKEGYVAIDIVGWASKPFYDKDKKTLHWAKELHFGTDPQNTLNYNLRILGRKGVFVLNAVASMREMGEVKASINNVLGSVTFNAGERYSDFNPDVDQVAAWSIGGLVAGKVLAKVGFFALLAKFWKIIALAVAGGFAGFVRWFRGRRKKNDQDLVNELNNKSTEPKAE
jgi:uncharacterized membrane-anchored protein